MAAAGAKPTECALMAGLRTSPIALALIAGLPVLAGLWALLSPKVLLSREMTWDFLYIFSGAWQMQHGHVPHVDFHQPHGDLNFALTWLGFQLVGPNLSAYFVGVVIVLAGVFASALLATMRRLPTVPAALFVIFVSLLVLMPANVGDKPDAYCFGMPYNRYSWSLLSILALILFVPPRTGVGSDWIDVGNGAFLLAALFYFKITYFAAAGALLALAILISPHVRTRLVAWIVVGSLVVANAVAPWNWPYLVDIVQIARAGSVRSSLDFHLTNFFANVEGYIPYVAGLVIAGWMWMRGLAPLRLPLATAALLAVGAFVLSQNYQTHGLPLGIVIAYLLYDQIRERFGSAVPALPVVMLFPLFSIAASAYSLATYQVRTGRVDHLRVVENTQIKGLAVRAPTQHLLSAFAEGPPNAALLNRARVGQPRYELTPTEYVETLVEATTVLSSERYRPGRIVVLDQVNPLPFMLGWQPPRGGNLWQGLVMPKVPAGETFAEADYVLIPKFSTYSPWTNQAQVDYGAYLAQNFPAREETRSWVILRRAAADGRQAQAQSKVTR